MEGNLIYADAARLEDTTNIVAEATTMLKASRHCKQSNYEKVILQSDSLLLQKIWKWSCPWSIKDHIEDVDT